MSRSRKAQTGGRSPRPPAAPRPAPVTPAPPIWRDPWALAPLVAALLVVVAARATSPGEPFSDDMLFLDFSVRRGNPSWWDGGGGLAYWRPLARQAYYGALGPLMLAHPAALAVLHALALALAGLLLQRALRRVWPAPAAAAAATFPLLMEAARTLYAWPSGAQDLGALVFLAIALHAASRGRAWLVAIAGVAAALCKEVAAPLALLAALAPFSHPPRTTRRLALATGGALAAWAVLRFALPHFGSSGGLGAIAAMAPAGAAKVPIALRLLQATGHALLDAFGLGRAPAGVAPLVALVVLAPLVAAFAIARWRASGAWLWSAWGLAWFALGAWPLALFLPDWASFRCVLPAAGLGIALVAPLVAAPAGWLLPLVAARVVALLLAPQPPAVLTLTATDAGDALSFPRLAQLQRTVHGVRALLRARVPKLPRGARLMREGWPRMTGVAFAGDASLRLWYGDSTLAWVTQEALEGPAAGRPMAMLEFEPDRVPQLVVVNREALDAVVAALVEMRAQHWPEALAALEHTEAVTADTNAAGFLANLAGWRASCLLNMDRVAEAEAQSRLAIARYADTPNGRYTLAQARMARGDDAGAVGLLRDAVERNPGDADVRRLLGLAEQRVAAAARR